MNRAETLEAAKKCVCGDREQDYGNPEDSFRRTAAMWTALFGVRFTAADVAEAMICLKLVREKTGHSKADNWIDIAGYAACGCEIQGGVK